MTMKACCISDLHGHLPNIPDCDLLLIGGDLCRHHRDLGWYNKTFANWIKENAKRMKVVGVAGNHDFIFQESPDSLVSMDWTYLEDSGITWNGLNIWGSPWQPRFYDWAFNADEPDLERIWNKIPSNTDILLLHGPPHGYGDFSPYDKIHTGSPSLLKKILEIQPKLVVAGHIHSGYGRYLIGNTIFVNASYVNEQYNPTNEPVMVEL
jgi:Icc-related predicted phosphoesterase